MTTKAPLPVAVEDAINELEIEYPPTGGHDIRGGEHYSNIIRAHIAALEAENKRLREATIYAHLEIRSGCIQPAFEGLEAALAPAAEKGVVWPTTYCPECGGGGEICYGHKYIKCTECNGSGKAGE